MLRDQYLYRKNRRTKDSNVLLGNSAKIVGNRLLYYRGLKNPGSDDYKCGRNEYSVNANHYTAIRIGVDCRRKYEIFEIRENAERINEYLKSIGSDKVIS